MSDQQPRDLAWLNSKWWYRLLKVFYVLALILSFLLSLLVGAGVSVRLSESILEKPYFRYVSCSDGSRVNLSFNGFVDTHYPHMSDEDRRIKRLCAGMNETRYQQLLAIPVKNLLELDEVDNAKRMTYSIELNTRGWATAIGITVLFGLITFFLARKILNLVVKSIHYVMIGKFI